MNDIEALRGIDGISWIFQTLMIIAAFVAAVALISKLVEFIKKPTSWINSQNKDHEDLETMRTDYDNFKMKMLEYGKRYADLKEEMDKSEQYYFKMMTTLSEFTAKTEESIDTIVKRDEEQDLSIKHIQDGVMELLGDKIDQRYLRYTQNQGIPEAEVGEFENIYAAYEALGGNGCRKLKHERVQKMEIQLEDDDGEAD